MSEIENKTNYSTEKLIRRWKDFDVEFFYEHHIVVHIRDEKVIFMCKERGKNDTGD